MTQMYKITGTLPNGKRFKPILTSNYRHAMMHNIYKGTLWECDNVGYQCGIPKWRRIHTWWN